MPEFQSHSTQPARAPLNWPEIIASCPVCGSQLQCSFKKGDIIFREGDPALAERVVLDFAARLREAWSLRVMVTQRAQERIIRLLLKLADRFGRPAKIGILIDMPITRRELAEFAGTTIETTIRTLSRLRKAGLIDQSGRRVIILEPERLAAEVSSGE